MPVTEHPDRLETECLLLLLAVILAVLGSAAFFVLSGLSAAALP